jgi:hypothetical protein
MRLAQRLPEAQTCVIAACAILVIGFLVWPMVFTSAGMAQDWSNHLWYLWQQSITINRDHQASLFLNYGGAVFYPFYAFYGGTIYALFGGLAVVLGNAPVVAYVFSYILGFAAAYGGWYLLARMVGLGKWQAQVPGLLFITSAYYLTLIYARGDWPEFVAVSTLPLFIAAGLRVMLADRLPLRWAIVLAACALVFFGAHNITMLWGVTALVISGLAIAVIIPQARRSVTRRGVIRVAVVVVPAALVNAWFLLPALAYGQRTTIAKTFDYVGTLHELAPLVSDSKLFTLSRATVVPNTPDFALALPMLAVAWVVVSIVLSFILGGDTAWRRALLVLSAVSVAFAVLMTHVGLILALPHPYTLLQFSYRLETYVLLGLSGAVIAALMLARTWPRRWRMWSWTTVIVLVASGVGAVQQVDGYPKGNGYPGVVRPDRYMVFNPKDQPPFSGGLGDYNDATLPAVEPRIPVGILFPETAVRDDKVTLATSLPPGTLVHSNLLGAPYLVAVKGARVVGHDTAGRMVLEIGPAKDGQEQITLSRSNRLPVALGRLVTHVALAVLLIMLAGYLTRRLLVKPARQEG